MQIWHEILHLKKKFSQAISRMAYEFSQGLVKIFQYERLNWYHTQTLFKLPAKTSHRYKLKHTSSFHFTFISMLPNKYISQNDTATR